MYDFILTEGDLRRVLATIEQRRQQDGRSHCLQIHIEPGQGTLQAVRATIETLTSEMLAEMRAKGQLDLT